jgi:hypothetical protein
MAFFNPSNQLIQIDTGSVATYLWNQSQSPIQVYSAIGEAQVLGQRYFGVSNPTPANPYGTPAIFILVQYLSTSATVIGNVPAAPAPVYWTDQTYTTVSGISTESAFGLNGIAGFMQINTTSLPNLTTAKLLGANILIQVAGYLAGAVGPASGTAGVGNALCGYAGNFASQAIVAGTAPGYRTLGIQASAVAAGVCNVMVNCDMI